MSIRIAAGSVLVVMGLLGATSMTVAQERSPHVPTGKELEQRRSGVSAGPKRGYQQRSVQQARSWVQGAREWVRSQVPFVTPARVLLVVGVFGVLISMNKNKRLVRWAVITAFSYLLAAFGACAMIFDWPMWN